jgi:hypothetical protein
MTDHNGSSFNTSSSNGSTGASGGGFFGQARVSSELLQVLNDRSQPLRANKGTQTYEVAFWVTHAVFTPNDGGHMRDMEGYVGPYNRMCTNRTARYMVFGRMSFTPRACWRVSRWC